MFKVYPTIDALVIASHVNRFLRYSVIIPDGVASMIAAKQRNIHQYGLVPFSRDGGISEGTMLAEIHDCMNRIAFPTGRDAELLAELLALRAYVTVKKSRVPVPDWPSRYPLVASEHDISDPHRSEASYRYDSAEWMIELVARQRTDYVPVFLGQLTVGEAQLLERAQIAYSGQFDETTPPPPVGVNPMLARGESHNTDRDGVQDLTWDRDQFLALVYTLLWYADHAHDSCGSSCGDVGQQRAARVLLKDIAASYAVLFDHADFRAGLFDHNPDEPVSG